MKNQKFIYVHIFKTGGTSLHHTLLERYPDQFLYDTTFRNERKTHGIVKLVENTDIYKPEDYDNYDIIMGHFTYEKYEHLNRLNITMLRDPLTRFISHYSNLRRLDKIRKRKGRQQHNDSFEVFCEKCKNIYIHFTDGKLDNFNFIGFLEYYDKSMQILSDITGYNTKIKKIKNRTKKQDKLELSKRKIEYFNQVNKEDYEFYNYALDEFKNKYLD